MRAERRERARERLLVADVGEHRVEPTHRRRGSAGTGMPARAIQTASPRHLSATVLPPAFGPEMTRPCPPASRRSIATTSMPPPMRSGCRIVVEVDLGAVVDVDHRRVGRFAEARKRHEHVGDDRGFARDAELGRPGRATEMESAPRTRAISRSTSASATCRRLLISVTSLGST